jgi:predicted metal-dependent hydrolase
MTAVGTRTIDVQARPRRDQGRQVVSVTPRDVHFKFHETPPSDWLGGDVVGTAVFNALSLTLPEGERLFMDAIRQYRAQLSGQLLDEVRAFMAQEAVHAREHGSINQLVDRRRYPVDSISAQIRERVAQVRERGPFVMLSVTIALEHFTAMMADQLLNDQSLLSGAPEEIASLWRWHAVEETEHKAVAYDVFQEATKAWSPGKRLTVRRKVMGLVTLVFVRNLSRHAARLLAADGMDLATARARVLWYLFGKPGLLRKMWRHYAGWYRSDFHPWDHDNRGVLERWRAEFPLESVRAG